MWARRRPSGRKVVAHFADGSQAEGDLPVGADGVHSQTRAQILPDASKPQFVGIIGIGGAIARSEVPELSLRETQSFTFTFGPSGFFGF
jgi:2-polyprenyl-6-methoxyphenol hydroxylase-like FAD-dependent oxidoreductase